jgi:DNA-binding transcriptional regulator GbsR (MarR family)
MNQMKPHGSGDVADDNATELQFAEEMGRFFETGGLPRMAGRVWATLLVTDTPRMSAAALQEALGASAGSISNATRTLLQIGLIDRVPVRGERRDYFAPRRGAIADLLRMRLERLVAVESLISDAVEHFGDRPHAGEHLNEIHDIYHWYAQELPKVHERFVAEQRAVLAKREG